MVVKIRKRRKSANVPKEEVGQEAREVKWPNSDEVCRQVAEAQDGVCLLAFSRGKDSWGAWVQLRRYFRRIIPYFCADVPGLRFIEEDLKRSEDIMGVPILRYVSPSLFSALDRGAWQTPAQAKVFDGMEMFRDLNNFDVDADVRARSGVDENTLVAHGWRIHDSPRRRQQLVSSGPIWDGWGWFEPIWDWTHNRLEQELRDAKIRLPVDYRLFGRSFEGVRHRFLEPLRTAYPDDYERVLNWFPLADADAFRRTL